jgi:nifR3 family TIM-barrel protein
MPLRAELVGQIHQTMIPQSCNIGAVRVSPPTLMAPLAGITNLPLRLIAKRWGAGLVCSEMISANGLAQQSQNTLRMLDSNPAEQPLSVQIFGADAVIMARAAEMVQRAGAAVVDINFGCAVRKVVKTGAGAALMKAPQRTARILEAVRRALSVPLTIKIRSGWTDDGAQALETARIAYECGVDAIAVHPRTATQGFRGCADWTVINRVRQAVPIPVIGNGDITSAVHARAMFDQTGCHAVMIGRAAIGNPWLFAEVRAELEGSAPPVVDAACRRRAMMRYLDASIAYYGEYHGCRIMRSRLGWFVKGMPNSSRFREAITRLSSRTEVISVIDDFFRSAEGSFQPPL